MRKVTNIRKAEDGRWTWECDGVAYATNQAGNGIFVEDEYGFFTKQTIGTDTFIACKTMSGMRRKLKSWFEAPEIYA